MSSRGERYLDIQIVADKVGLSTKSVRRLVKKRQFPLPFVFGGGWTWLESEVDRWMRRVAIENEIDPDDLPEEKSSGNRVDKPGHPGTTEAGGDIPASGKAKTK